MSYTCDRCGDKIKVFGLSYAQSLDHRQDQPNFPPEADDEHGHLCKGCRDDFREFMEY